jgi:hypothetical protein
MENKEELVLKVLADSIDKLDKHQSEIKRAVSVFKKHSCFSDPCAALNWIESNDNLIKKEVPEIFEIKDQINILCKDVILKFEAYLREAILSEGWILSGQWPKYYIEHVLPVIIDEKKYCILIGEDIIQTFLVKKIITNIKSQLKKLKPDLNKLNTFLQEMCDAYLKLASNQYRTISVYDLYREMTLSRQPIKLWRNASSINFRPFPELEFKACLTQLLKLNLTTINTLQLRLLPPISKGESIFIYEPFENRFCHVGRIEFISTRG